MAEELFARVCLLGNGYHLICFFGGASCGCEALRCRRTFTGSTDQMKLSSSGTEAPSVVVGGLVVAEPWRIAQRFGDGENDYRRDEDGHLITEPAWRFGWRFWAC